MRYTLSSVLEALEVLYSVGYTSICVDDFLCLFCEANNLDVQRESRQIGNILRVLDKQNKISIKNDEINLWGMLSSNLRLVINDSVI